MGEHDDLADFGFVDEAIRDLIPPAVIERSNRIVKNERGFMGSCR
jgi:hypothetical protein